MGFWTLLQVASMPVLQVLIISSLGSFLATQYCNLLTADARKHINNVVFKVFTPSLLFASLAKTVTLQQLISWWFMFVNVGLGFLFGGLLGLIIVKILKPEQHLEGLIIAICSTGNLGNLILIIVPAICNESANPFSNHSHCSSTGLSYASFSMAFGGLFIWTFTYHLIKRLDNRDEGFPEAARASLSNIPNNDLDGDNETTLLREYSQLVPSTNPIDHYSENNANLSLVSDLGRMNENVSLLDKIKGYLRPIITKGILAPPTAATIIGFAFGATPWLKNLIVGDNAPLRVIQDSVKLLGNGTIPCITLILGGNLTQGLRSARLRPLVIIAVICVRYIILPVIGIGVVQVAGKLGFLPSDPLFRFVLMLQFTVPPAMNISTMTQLVGVSQDECSVLFLWTYLAAAFALTAWSTLYMWILV